jgi:hypothetical protein
MSVKSVKTLLLVAAVYDIVAGLVFALCYRPIYERFGVDLPNHAGYVQLSALFVFVFGIGFYIASRDPVRNLGIILMGILMKASFVLVVFYNTYATSSPQLYIPFAAADAVFMLLFWVAYRSVRKMDNA